MTQAMIDRLTERQRHLVEQAMALMDSFYDAEMELLIDEEQSDRHNTRSSAHYALGLLIRSGEGDHERAVGLLNKVMDLQFDCPDEIYHGTFRVSPQAALPPAGNYNWKEFAPGFAYFLSETTDKIGKRLGTALSREISQVLPDFDELAVRRYLQSAVDEVLPPVWKSYDPNWREFIASTFAVILGEFGDVLPAELVSRMDESMQLAVSASIDRRLSDAVPMNSNIELMHIFIVHYYGHRFAREDWTRHADQEAAAFLAAYAEFGSIAEFNTTTYYGVDLTVLGLWRTYGCSAAFRETGQTLERGMWNNIALFYNPVLENLSGPFSRAYEMEMTGHSSIGVFLYLALGAGYEHLAAPNCETTHDPLIALAGVDIPAELMPQFVSFGGSRRVEKQFRELCERDKPGENRNLCTAAAWIGEKRMIGAMSGSRNTNGQMHPATIHWMDTGGARYDLRLIRREPGKSWNSHLRGMIFEATAEKDLLTAAVRLDTDVPVEVLFEITGPGLAAARITPERWILPALGCSVVAAASAPSIQLDEPGEKLEIIYLHCPEDGVQEMTFTLRLDPASE
ncbi:hypothetical protein MKZ24_29835 [Paenibacillus sp. FSL R7-0297]|uniref:hypothetical protein n=1 Tax=unclassified Paenibacillus TaxID=185978 RepID=UPI0004F6779A|nr:hypothetical protein [Paenibacillus sp. FSL R5-0912]AIQ40010.1 hypothetical protein R50912_08180 [Paenibacillus sp. FSL R5-0912]